MSSILNLKKPVDAGVFKVWVDLFAKNDVGNKGYLTKEELTNLMHGCGVENVNPDLLDCNDVDDDGKLSFEELLNMMQCKMLDRPEVICEVLKSKKPADAGIFQVWADKFEAHDIGAKGYLAPEELKALMHGCGVENVNEGLHDFADSDGDGKLEFEELLKLMNCEMLPLKASAVEEVLKKSRPVNAELFQVWADKFVQHDNGEKGYLTSEELKALMNGCGVENVNEGLHAFADQDGDGKLEFEELLKLMNCEMTEA